MKFLIVLSGNSTVKIAIAEEKEILEVMVLNRKSALLTLRRMLNNHQFYKCVLVEVAPLFSQKNRLNDFFIRWEEILKERGIEFPYEGFGLDRLALLLGVIHKFNQPDKFLSLIHI
mgnify:CR=1 FL=1